MPVKAARRPQLGRATPLIAIAAARQVVEEVSIYLGQPLPGFYAAGLAHRATRAFAHSASFREKVSPGGDTGRDKLYLFLRHWLAARLHADRPRLYAQLPRDFSLGNPLPDVEIEASTRGGRVEKIASPGRDKTAPLCSAPFLSPEAHLLLG